LTLAAALTVMTGCSAILGAADGPIYQDFATATPTDSGPSVPDPTPAPDEPGDPDTPDSPTRADGGSPSPAPVVHERAVISAVWVGYDDDEGGRSLHVTPEPWVRDDGMLAFDVTAAELEALYPAAGTASMRNQLLCHMIGARDKATWNLEPWRPDVGLQAVLEARCNPR
jgi:hypothetical protein